MNDEFVFWLKVNPESEISIETYVPEHIQHQSIKLFINDQLAYESGILESGNFSFKISQDAVRNLLQGRLVKIRLHSEKSVIPALSGRNTDERKLSLIIKRISAL